MRVVTQRLLWLVSITVAAGAFALAAAAPADTATLPAGFAETQVATGLASPTAMAFAPDGRLFVAEQGGRLRVIKNGTLLADAVRDRSPSTRPGERGLLGVAFDPNFATNQFVYVYYTTADAAGPQPRQPLHGQRRRRRRRQRGADPRPRTTSRRRRTTTAARSTSAPTASSTSPSATTPTAANAQTLCNRLGKILRINADGTIPTDNPFFDTRPTGANRAIWALGLRNPFTFTFQPGTGRMFINDVGQNTWEEIDDGVAGANYGWPTTEGDRRPIPSFTRAALRLQPRAAARSGLRHHRRRVLQPGQRSQFPAEYVGDYFFADYCSGWINAVRPGAPTSRRASPPAPPARSTCASRADGSLYYLTRGAGGSVFRVSYTGSQAPTITPHPAGQTVSIGGSATFSVAASGAPPLAYQWQRDGVDIAGATSSTYTPDQRECSDHGARFRALVSNPFGIRDEQRRRPERHREPAADQLRSRRPPRARCTAAARRSPTRARLPTPRTARWAAPPSPGRSTSTTPTTCTPSYRRPAARPAARSSRRRRAIRKPMSSSASPSRCAIPAA